MTTRPSIRLHGERPVGLQVPVRQGIGLLGDAGTAVLLERRDPVVQPRVADGRRGLPASSGSGGHRGPPAGDRRIALIWTTTPWTLPSNLAIVVHPDIDYVLVEPDFTGTTERYVMAADACRAADSSGIRRAGLEQSGGGAADRRRSARPLVARRRSPTTWDTSTRTGWLRPSFVTTEDGTGLVHRAPVASVEDMAGHRRQ